MTVTYIILVDGYLKMGETPTMQEALDIVWDLRVRYPGKPIVILER